MALTAYNEPVVLVGRGANLLLHGGGETPAFLAAATANRGE